MTTLFNVTESLLTKSGEISGKQFKNLHLLRGYAHKIESFHKVRLIYLEEITSKYADHVRLDVRGL